LYVRFLALQQKLKKLRPLLPGKKVDVLPYCLCVWTQLYLNLCWVLVKLQENSHNFPSKSACRDLLVSHSAFGVMAILAGHWCNFVEMAEKVWNLHI